MANLVVGTAGHVDHGKTTLVKALTGVDTDRLQEEKERGISIDLGFAPLQLPNGSTVGLVDVPGHERFIKNMMAGVAGMDLVMLIIAADEGIMPQTREHLDIITLLGVPRGIIVITKVDLVDGEWLELIEAEVREFVHGTPLEQAPMVEVSAVTKQGVPELLQLLEELGEEGTRQAATGKFRLAVDRVFSVTGFGTVITGTLSSGQLQVGDEVAIYPQELASKVRGLQNHGQAVKEVCAGQRVAINLAGIEVKDINRGDMIAAPGSLTPSYRMDVELTLLKTAPKELTNRQRVRVHLGTREIIGRVVLLDRDTLEPGDSCFAQLALEEETVAGKHDRFVLRTYSPMLTIAGGQIVDAYPSKHKRFKPEVVDSLSKLLAGTPAELVLEKLLELKVPTTLGELEKALTLPLEELRAALSDNLADGSVVKLQEDKKEYYVTTQQLTEWIKVVQRDVEDYQQKYPLRPGLAKEEVRSKIFRGISNKTFNILIDYWEEQEALGQDGQFLSTFGFKPKPSGEQEQLIATIEQELLRDQWQPPAWSEIIARLKINEALANELLIYLLNTGTLIKIEDNIYFAQAALTAAKVQLEELIDQNEEGVSLAQVRDKLNSSRKYVLPLLEYFDRTKVTRRVGDLRKKF